MSKFGKVKEVFKIISTVFAYIACALVAYDAFMGAARDKGLIDLDGVGGNETVGE